MQHLDASRYDMLVISEPLDESYHLGVPFLGENIHELIHWLANHKTVQAYHSIRTLGFSAGGYPAILAAHRLKAELALSISSRFYRFKKHPAYFFERVFNFWRYARSGHHPKVRLTFANDSKRDRRSAKIIACLCRSELASLSFKEPQVHDVLVKVAARGELKAFLETYLLDTPLNDERENQIAAQKLA